MPTLQTTKKMKTRHILTLALALVVSINLQGQNKPNGSTKAGKSSTLPVVTIDGTDKVSYVRSYDFFKALTSDGTIAAEITSGNVMQSTQYVDGLGRPIQTVARKALPGGKDLVQFVIYDNMGRQVYQPMPFQSDYTDGRLHLTPSARQGTFMNGHYASEDIFYGKVEFDGSPANRVIKQMAPGNSWAGSDKGVASKWRANNTADGVRRWSTTGTPSSTAAYAAGELMVSITTDEENHQVKEFTDKLGRVILKQVQNTGQADGHNDWLNTYYVYDDYGNLTYVIPPRAVEELINLSWSWVATDMDPLVFKYSYDHRNRMIEKTVPGAEKVEMVYDKLDRLVATRDGEQRNNGKWLVTKYDALSRPVITGIYTNSDTRASLQTTVDGWNNDPFVQKDALTTVGVIEGLNITVSHHVPGTTIYRVKTGGEAIFLPAFDSNGEEFDTEEVPSLSTDYTYYQGYYDATFPVIDSNLEVLTVSYFDDYDFTTRTYDSNKEQDFYPAGTNNAVDPDFYANVKGLATGSKVKVLGTANDWLTTVMFYDDRGRVIQTHADNHVGGTDIATTQYDFSGKVLNTYTIQNNPNAINNSQVPIAKRFIYDGAGTGRLLEVKEKLFGVGYKTIVTNSYNDLGELKDKVLGNNLETLSHKYNVRGWLESINETYVSAGTGTNYFGMELSYDHGFTNNQLNGNIAGVKWRSKSNSTEQRAYGFEYDASNRLKKADYSQGAGWTNTVSDFSTTYGYDANGNILSLTRKGVVAGSIQTIDNLTYAYMNSGKSNQLMTVTDAAGDLGQGDFVDRNTTGVDYTYDKNGNMDIDKNKDITAISYNHLNLPKTVTFTNNRSITYTYDAAGIKLRKAVNDNGSIKVTDYVGGMIFEDNTLQHIAHEEGRVRVDGAALKYDYYIKDHLGNTRMTLTESPDVTVYLATMEAEHQNFEESVFLNMDQVRHTDAAANYTVDNTITVDEVSRLNGTDAARRVGPAKLMAVSPGDQVNIEAYAYHKGGYSNNGSISQGSVVAAIAAAFGGVSGGSAEQQAIYDLFNANAATVFVGGSGTASNPKAYLNYILFDQDFNYQDAGYAQVSNTANTHQMLTLSKSITKGGYIYVYVSNESNSNFDVFFDDVRVTHSKGNILQEDHYYPFGLSISALSSTAPLSKPNNYKFNGNEEQTDFSWDIYDFNARFYDASLGRFMNIDPLADQFVSYTPYHFTHNNPTNLVDPTGMSAYGQTSVAEDRAAHDAALGIEPEEEEEEKDICPKCPDGKEYDSKRNSEMNFSYIEGIGAFIDPDVVVTPSLILSFTTFFQQLWNPINENLNVRQARIEEERKLDLLENGPSLESGALEPRYPLFTALTIGGRSAFKGIKNLFRSRSHTLSMGPTGEYYSVAHQMTLSSNLYPGVNASRHFTAANRSMLSTLDDATMNNLNIVMKTRPNGSIIMNRSPHNWVWHHDVGNGVMQLVPKIQHSPGSIFWKTLHPGGRGGMSIWGGGY